MRLYRVTVCVPGSPRFAFTGLYASGFDAAAEAQADWPRATGISVIHITQATHRNNTTIRNAP